MQSLNTALWAGQRVLVTGASGLVGSHLVASVLAAGAEVTVLLRDADLRSALARSGALPHVNVVTGDLECFEDVERAVVEAGNSVIFHLGAQTIVGVGVHAPLLTLESNVRGTYNLLEACRRHAARVERVVVASSDKAYGHSDTAYSEDQALRAGSPYDTSKAAADLIAQSYYTTYGLPLAILRCGNTYGGGDLNWSRIVPGTIRSLLRGEAPRIRSDGTFIRDYIYVADVVAAYCTVAEAMSRADVVGQAFNIASGQRVTVLEVVSTVSALIGGPLPAPQVLNTATNEIREQRLQTEKAHRVLRWSAQVTLLDGLKETIAWYRSYLEIPDD